MLKNITIAIPTYNRCSILIDNLNHILNSELEVKVLVSDNCSSDQTWRKLNEINDNRLSIIRNNQNLGFTGNLLKLIEASQTDYIYFISDEDRVDIQAFNNMLSKIKHDEYGAIYSSVKDNHDGFILRYDDCICNDINQGLTKAAFKRSYFSGAVFNKNFIDLDIFKSAISEEEIILYPHEIFFLMAINKSGMCLFVSDTTCFQYHVVDSDYYNEFRYDRFIEREKLIKRYDRVINKVFSNKEIKKIILKSLCIFSADIFLYSFIVLKFRDKYSYSYFSTCFKLFKCHFIFAIIKIIGTKVNFSSVTKLFINSKKKCS